MNKPVTLWYLQYPKGEDFNHLEDGHSTRDHPVPVDPTFKNQAFWHKANWRKEHAWLDADNKVVNDVDCPI